MSAGRRAGGKAPSTSSSNSVSRIWACFGFPPEGAVGRQTPEQFRSVTRVTAPWGARW